jgi:hypothetical protein
MRIREPYGPLRVGFAYPQNEDMRKSEEQKRKNSASIEKMG